MATGYTMYGQSGSLKSSKWNPRLTRPDLPTAQPEQPAAPSYWRPAEFSRPATPYPMSPYAMQPGGGRGGRSGTTGRGLSIMGGGGGGTGMLSASAFNPTNSMGPGSYYPGGSGEFNRNMQQAMLNPQVAAAYSASQPAAMAALMQHQAARPVNRLAMMRWGDASARAIAGGMGGGGSGGGLAGGYQSAFDEARMENEARYRDTLAGGQDRYERNMNRIAGMGGQERKDINDSYDDQEAARRQSLIGRGLGNSTIVDTMQMGNERERTDALGRLEERLRREQVDTDAALSGDVLGIMERRSDTYPDYNQLAQLAQGLGAAGVGQPGGAGSGGAVGFMPARVPVNMGFQMPMGGGFGGGGGGGGGGGKPNIGQQNVAQRVAAINRLRGMGLTEHQARLVLGGEFDLADFLP